MAALLEILRILRLAQRLGGTSRRAVGQSVLHVIGHGLVEHLARDVAVLHAQAVAPVGIHGRLTDRLESLFAVEAPDALHDGVATATMPGLPTMQSVSLPHRCHTGRRPCSSEICSIVCTMSAIFSGCSTVISGIAAR